MVLTVSMGCDPPPLAMTDPSAQWATGDHDLDGWRACLPGWDAWSPASECDCDDSDPSIRPGADELCNGRDDDCDVLVDEGLSFTVWWPDFDQDGYGDGEAANLANETCDGPPGLEYADNDSDCDDVNADVHPGAPETCDGLDNDCNGAVDDGLDLYPFFPDSDQDGFGDPEHEILTCDGPPPGFISTDGSDCDDTDEDSHPGATELCDGKDNDCDGGIDEGLDVRTLHYDGDEDGYGATPGDPVDDTGEGPTFGETIEACRPPAGYVVHAGDCDDTDSRYHPGAAEGCADPDYNCDGIAGAVDTDGDGFLACAVGTDPGDCDDLDASIRPGGVEVCDGWDNDCNGETDDAGVQLWWMDTDGDGYGDDNSVRAEDADPEGRDDCFYPGNVQTGGDCDDLDASAYPGAPEQCDGADNDCDQEVDEGLPVFTYYPDQDGDQYGGSGTPVESCRRPAGYVSNSDDCDDSSIEHHPGAVESCDDPEDYDCDGSGGSEDADLDGAQGCEDCDDFDDAIYPGAEVVCDGGVAEPRDVDCDGVVDTGGDAKWFRDTDGDGFGMAEESEVWTGCAPQGWSLEAGDCDDTAATVHPGATEACDGVDNDCDGAVDDGFDLDNDGFTTCGADGDPNTLDDNDCDDEDETRKPTAVEVCDGVDQDCDGTVDDGFDLDGDGHTSCGGDCDDKDGAINPAQAEICDGRDQNCNGAIDEGFDVDGDGYTPCQGDCNEGNPYIYPGASIVPVYRLYKSNDHLFTISWAEVTSAQSAGWLLEGNDYAFSTSGAGMTPVYRAYSSGKHFYTINYDELQSFLQAGWVNEGIGWYAHAFQPVGALPWYRLYKNGYYHYTMDEQEVSISVDSGWTLHGVAAYMYYGNAGDPTCR